MKQKIYNQKLEVKLPDTLANSLTAAAAKYGYSESEITREALREYLKQRFDYVVGGD